MESLPQCPVCQMNLVYKLQGVHEEKQLYCSNIACPVLYLSLQAKVLSWVNSLRGPDSELRILIAKTLYEQEQEGER